MLVSLYTDRLMKKAFVFLIITFCLLPILCAQRRSCRVVDAETGKGLEGVLIRFGDKQTLTNAEGRFAYRATTDSLYFHCIGYRNVARKANEVGDTILLVPLDYVLDEVVVMPTERLLQKITASTYSNVKPHLGESSDFFYRQTSMRSDSCFEISEAWVKGCNALNVRDLKFSFGRTMRAKDETEINRFRNLFILAMLTPLNFSGRNAPVITPLVRKDKTKYYYGKVYSVQYDVLSDNCGHNLYRIDFEDARTASEGKPIIVGSIFADMETLRILRFRGAMKHLPIRQTRQDGTTVERIAGTVTFDMSYAYNRGFMEVYAAHAELADTIDGKDYTYKITLFRTDGHDLKAGQKMYSSTNLLGLIDRNHLDNDFWERNAIVQRTQKEIEAILNWDAPMNRLLIDIIE